MLFELFFFPGTLMHELSHMLLAFLTGSKIKKVKLSLKESYVMHEDKGPYKTIAIAIAPFFINNFVAYLFLSIAFAQIKIINTVILLWLSIAFSYASIPSKKDIDNIYKKSKELLKNIGKKGFLYALISLPINLFLITPIFFISTILNLFNEIFVLRIIIIIFLFSLI